VAWSLRTKVFLKCQITISWFDNEFVNEPYNAPLLHTHSTISLKNLDLSEFIEKLKIKNPNLIN
jgi:hypothetical protein